MKLLITGGAGFIGSNFCQYVLRKDSDLEIINYDALTYAGNLENLASLDSEPRYQFFKGDIRDAETLKREVFDKHTIDGIIHFAAESHVDRSISDSRIFLESNIIGTQVLLDCARDYEIPRFIHVSTDEVYGSLGMDGEFSEETPLAPNSPYAASKASSDMIVRSYAKTYGLPAIITRCSNNYGPYQFPEKFIPLMIANALEDKKLPIYGKGDNIRDWLYVEDHCSAIELIFRKGKEGEVYNIGGGTEMTNLDLAKLLLQRLDKPESLLHFVTDRLGHDFRYAINYEKLSKDLGWEPKHSFEDGLSKTIDWYLQNQKWLETVRSGEYKEYYSRHYQVIDD